MKFTQIITLKNHLDREKIEEIKKDTPELNLNGLAILLGQGSELEIGRELFILGNNGLKNTTKGLKIHTDRDTIPQAGSIDDNSREFLIKYTAMNEWIFNSSSLNAKDFTGLEDFDKNDIKEQLLKLASIL
jgi:hypothetical protein